MMKKKHQQGFTLVELMIVVAIIGILASIAIPQYQTYTQRAEATTSIAGIRTAQLAIQEYYANTGKLPAKLTDLNRYGTDAQSLLNIAASNNIINTVTFNDTDASIVILYNTVINGAPADLAEKTLVLLPTATNGVVKFGVGSASTLNAKFHPNL